MRLMVFLVAGLLMSLSGLSRANPAVLFDPLSLYGNKIEFDVLRDGDVVGKHITSFKQEDDQLTVTSSMNIDIYMLFLPVYGFDYHAEEVWQNNRMVFLSTDVVDGTDRMSFQATRDGNALNVVLPERDYVFLGDIFPTNHWNADVLSTNRVINTLTGNINRVTITPKGPEEVEIVDGVITANRYDYSGELKDTSVWYDEDGRWVKLRFLARDGSEIEYLCHSCSAVNGS